MAIRTIIEQVDSMKALVNAFSEYAQPVQIKTKRIDLHQLIRDVVELHKQQQNHIKYSFQFQNNLPSVLADPAALRQVLNNLILNAKDSLTSIYDPQAKISTYTVTKKERQYVTLEFSDNGPGFPPELLEKIFDPYVTTKEKGTGLGLAISRRLISEMGGNIQAENQRNEGATVIIQLLADNSTEKINVA